MLEALPCSSLLVMGITPLHKVGNLVDVEEQYVVPAHHDIAWLEVAGEISLKSHQHRIPPILFLNGIMLLTGSNMLDYGVAYELHAIPSVVAHACLCFSGTFCPGIK